MDLKNAMQPFSNALLDFYYGGENSPVLIVRDDGYRDPMYVKQYFRSREQFSPIEHKALGICSGKIVDLSAGVGADCLELQKRGFDVSAVEISLEACEIMGSRGVKKVYCMDLFDFSQSDYDTILLFGRSIGNVQNLDGLKRFLNHAKTILKPTGQILLDSVDVRKSDNPHHIAYLQKSIEMGRYFGEIITHFEYKGLIGPDFGILHIDPEKLQDLCEETNWNCEILYSEPEGNYLAKLIQI